MCKINKTISTFLFLCRCHFARNARKCPHREIFYVYSSLILQPILLLSYTHKHFLFTADSLNKQSTDLAFGYTEDGDDDNGPDKAEETEFDKLLKAAMKGKTKTR